MTDTRSEEHPHWRTRIRALGVYVGVMVFVLIETFLLFIISGQLTMVVIDPLLGPLVGVWSVAFLFTAPVGWFVLRGVVALVRGRGPWPYVEKPNDVLYYLTPGVSIK